MASAFREVTMAASSDPFQRGKKATLSTDRVVVARPHKAPLAPGSHANDRRKLLKYKKLISYISVLRLVAGGLLSSGRLSQRSSERS
jgi:hypothetical protein